MTMLITLLMAPCNLLSWLALVFLDLTPGFATAEEIEKVLVTVTDSAANMIKAYPPVMITKRSLRAVIGMIGKRLMATYASISIMIFSDTKQHIHLSSTFSSSISNAVKYTSKIKYLYL